MGQLLRRGIRQTILPLLLLGVAGCGGVKRFFSSSEPCPRESVVVVTNRTGETLVILLVRDGNEVAIGSASTATTVLRLPDGTPRNSRFKSRRARVAPTPAPRMGDLRMDTGGVSYNVQCR